MILLLMTIQTAMNLKNPKKKILMIPRTTKKVNLSQIPRILTVNNLMMIPKIRMTKKMKFQNSTQTFSQ